MSARLNPPEVLPVEPPAHRAKHTTDTEAMLLRAALQQQAQALSAIHQMVVSLDLRVEMIAKHLGV